LAIHLVQYVPDIRRTSPAFYNVSPKLISGLVVTTYNAISNPSAQYLGSAESVFGLGQALKYTISSGVLC
jgi:hypothetical protein